MLGCSEGSAIAADWLGRPESISWEGRCARCGGLGRFGVRQISGPGSVQREETPSECLDPEGCGWPYDLVTWMPLSDGEKAPWEEMRRTAQEADQLDFNERYNEQSPWERQQRAKAGEVLALLRRHIPADHLREVEDLLSSGSGCDYLRYELQRDHTRKALRKHMPAEHWQEIEDYIDRGVRTGRVSAALSEEGLPF